MTTTGLPYQTFGSPNNVFIGADAKITTRVGANETWVHDVEIHDVRGNRVLALHLTVEAAATLADTLTNLVAQNPTPWADLDMARLGATGVVAFT